VMDADSGKIIAKFPIGRGCDGCAFDPDRGLAFSSNGGDGTLTVVKEESPDQFSVIATIPTQRSARTMALDPTTHRIYLSAATAGPAPDGKAATKSAPADKGTTKPGPAGKGGGRRGNMVPGSFVVVVVSDY